MAMLLEPGMQSLRMGKAAPQGGSPAGGAAGWGVPIPIPIPLPAGPSSPASVTLPAPRAPGRPPAAPLRGHPPVGDPPPLLLRWGNQNQLRPGNLTRAGREHEPGGGGAPQQRGDCQN